MSAAFAVHGCELFNQRFPVEKISHDELLFDYASWAPLDAPEAMPAGSTRRLVPKDGMSPFGYAQWTSRSF